MTGSKLTLKNTDSPNIEFQTNFKILTHYFSESYSRQQAKLTLKPCLKMSYENL